MVYQVYALLVGINEYPGQIANLKGCENDVNAISEYLSNRVADESHQVHTRILLNQEATRDAVITGFREYLGRARQDDIVLFAFSGHGSQEPALQKYSHLEPDELNETLVCWDSRLDGHKDLSDKELAQLITDVAKNGPRITVILDCCHSGSGTRELGRFIPPDTRQHSLDSYFLSQKTAERLTQTRGLEPEAILQALPYGRHILLAACRDIEVAKEISVGGKIRGALSYYLLKTLQQASRPLSYRELYQRTYALLRGLQSPQLEVTNPSDVENLFLRQTSVSSLPYFTVTYDSAYGGWTINGGAVHGIPSINGSETTSLALYAFDSILDDLQLRAKAIGKAKVIEVLPQLSKVEIIELTGVEEFRSDLAFKAVVSDLPLPPVDVQLVGEDTGVEVLRQALLPGSNESSAYVREVREVGEARLRVIARDRTYWITSINCDRPLAHLIMGYTEFNTQKVKQHLEHIARWMRVLELANPAIEKIPPDAVKLQIFQGDQEIKDIPIRLEYEFRGSRWHPPEIQVKLTNQSEYPLYCAILGLAENYEISASWFEAGGIWLKPGEEAWTLGGKPIYFKIPKSLWEEGVTEFQDTLKLIVSTAEFDARLLEQGELGGADEIPQARGIAGHPNALNRLFYKVGNRTFSIQPEDEFYDDWTTTQLEFVTVRPHFYKQFPS